MQLEIEGVLRPVERATIEEVEEEILPYVEEKFRFSLSPKVVKPKGKVNIEGWFEAPDKVGEYPLYLLVGEALKYSVNTIKVREQETVTYARIQEAFKKAFAGRTATIDALRNWNFEDARYYVADIDKVREVLKETDIEKMRYEAEWYDCDDFTHALMGAFHRRKDTARTALFKTWVWWRKDQRILGHALCAMYDGRVLMIEPQLDKIFYPPRNWNLWNLEG